MFQHNDYTTDVWLLKLSEQQDPFRFRMHAQRVCIIAAYPVLRLCDASNIAALSAHDVSNTELPHEFAPSPFLHPHGNSVHNAPKAFIYYPQSPLPVTSCRHTDKHFFYYILSAVCRVAISSRRYLFSFHLFHCNYLICIFFSTRARYIRTFSR